VKASIVVPTYQEKENIKPLVERMGAALAKQDYEIIVVDDSSPDGTAEAAASLANSHPVRVIKREGVRGLGSAILEGFRNAKGDMMGAIDADLQHPPETLPELVAVIESGADLAIASRYVRGGRIEGWPLLRRLVSKGATLLARPLTRVRDPMSGYFVVARRAVEGKDFSSGGYKLLLEILVKGSYHRVKEVPYTFGGRRAGKSKLNSVEYARYLRLLFDLYLYKLRKTLVLSRSDTRTKVL
jgi:dolichol-phosphate mannosyltransferase